ncbi:hypothetical protein ACFV1N_46070 [Streptosporangium canum]|uniref:hypothetical protein n=1 Tax=Streptosporangium canum TaxID=324952 RepID=UPI0036A0974E
MTPLHPITTATAPQKSALDPQTTNRLATLCRLAVQGSHTQDIPLIMLITRPELPPITHDPQPLPMLALEGGLLHADLASPSHELDAAAGALARQVARESHATSTRTPRTGRVAGAALATLLVAGAVAWIWLMVAAIGVMTVYALGFVRRSRRQHYDIDATAVHQLNDVGSPGPHCLHVMLHDLESRQSSRGWLAKLGLSRTPTPRQRRLALWLPPHRLDWSVVGTCTVTGHRVGTRAHRSEHGPGDHCWPILWRWLPIWWRPAR